MSREDHSLGGRELSYGKVGGACQQIRPIWLRLYLTPKRFLLKRYRLDCQPLFRREEQKKEHFLLVICVYCKKYFDS